MEPQRLNNLISDVLKNVENRKGIGEDKIFHFLKMCVGKIIEKEITPVRIDRKIIILNVSSPAWMNELSFLKEKIVRCINRKAGKKIIKDIKFKIKR